MCVISTTLTKTGGGGASWFVANISTSDQHCFNVVVERYNVDPTLKMKKKTDVEFSTLHNVDTMSVSNVETMLIQLYLHVASTWPQH